MATVTATSTTTEHTILAAAPPAHKEPLKLSGVLDKEKWSDVTPVIGREVGGLVVFDGYVSDKSHVQFPEVNLKEWLEAPNSDELLRDLAITSK